MVPKVGGSRPLVHPTVVGLFARSTQAHHNFFVVRVRPVLSAFLFCALGVVCSFRRASSSMAEQRTLNPQVLGSNPRGRTIARFVTVRQMLYPPPQSHFRHRPLLLRWSRLTSDTKTKLHRYTMGTNPQSFSRERQTLNNPLSMKTRFLFATP